MNSKRNQFGTLASWLPLLAVLLWIEGFGIEGYGIEGYGKNGASVFAEIPTIPCKGSLKGAETLNFLCSVNAAYDVANQLSGVVFQVMDRPEKFQAFLFTNVVKGKLTATTYDRNQLRMYIDQVQTTAGHSFVNTKENMTGPHTLVITSITNVKAPGNRFLYVIHGRMSTTLTQRSKRSTKPSAKAPPKAGEAPQAADSLKVLIEF